MSHQYTKTTPLPSFSLWRRLGDKRIPLTFSLEVTARCNNNCRHCFINLPAADPVAMSKELSLAEIEAIADNAVSLGAMWCLITGGEPLLRKDFTDTYLMLKKKGLLVSVFTNACLISEKHVELFRKYPPRDIEVTVYGVTEGTYERVTGKPGSYKAFMRGLNLLLESGVRVRLKSMAIRSNVHELPAIAEFCRKHTSDNFRFDPLLHLRYDGDQKKNETICEERLSPEEIVAVEQADDERSESLLENCGNFIFSDDACPKCNHIFHCGAGRGGFSVSYDGYYRLCASLWHPDSIYDLRRGTLEEAWSVFTPRVLDMRSDDRIFLEKCRVCPIINLCLWCPAHADLEAGRMDAYCEYFCQVAHARADALRAKKENPAN